MFPLPFRATLRRMNRQLIVRSATTAVFVLLGAAGAITQRASAAHPGYTGGGVTLLPNGWRIAPAGVHMAIGDLPLAMTFSPDGRSLIVTNNGMARPTLRVVNLERRMVTQTFAMDDGWLGMAWHPDGGTFYSSGAAANSIAELKWQNGRFAPGSVIQLARSSRYSSDGSTAARTKCRAAGTAEFHRWSGHYP